MASSQRGWGFLVLLSRRRDGGSSCVGPARSHRSCHTEVKPTRELGTSSPDPPLPGQGCVGNPFLTPYRNDSNDSFPCGSPKPLAGNPGEGHAGDRTWPFWEH